MSNNLITFKSSELYNNRWRFSNTIIILLRAGFYSFTITLLIGIAVIYIDEELFVEHIILLFTFILIIGICLASYFWPLIFRYKVIEGLFIKDENSYVVHITYHPRKMSWLLRIVDDADDYGLLIVDELELKYNGYFSQFKIIRNSKCTMRVKCGFPNKRAVIILNEPFNGVDKITVICIGGTVITDLWKMNKEFIESLNIFINKG